MSDIDSLIDRIVALATIRTDTVGAILSVAFALDHENPYARFYKGDGSGRIKSARMRLDKDGPGWAITACFDIDDPYHETELELARYGSIVDIQLFPDWRPEGGVGLAYKHGEYGLLFCFTSESRRLLEFLISKK
ncbi:MAG: hypothetical protein QM784_31845 [Polyangiaceae bacterium]